jgi:tripartite-type tricarboxylate transporter receptor subunit TctC
MRGKDMRLTTRRFLGAAAALALAPLAFCGALGGLAAAPAAAQEFPTRVVKLIVPFPPAGATDIAARLIAEHLSKVWPYAMVVENRSGASGLIGTEAVARAPADGHTILMGTLATNVMAHLLQSNVPYARDAFEPAILLTSAANILMANSKVPASNLQELIVFAKANPGKVKYGSSGVGLSGHLGVELFAAAAGIKLVHVPYRGSAPSGQAFATGEVELTLGLIPQAMSAMKSAPGIKPIAIGAKERAPQFPDTPTFAELGYPNVLVYAINGLMVPKGTPKPIIDKIHRDALAGLKDPAIKERMEQLGLDVIGASPKEFGELLTDEFARWEPLIRANNIKAE